MSYFSLSRAKHLVGFSLALDVFILDQLVKWLLLEYALRPVVQPHAQPVSLWEWLSNPPSRLPFSQVEILPFFNLTMVWNEGVSFGMFQGSGAFLLVGLSFLIVAALSFWLLRAESWTQTIGLALAIGGALGNIFDRLRFGAVADFFDFYIGQWHYPAFNIADCGIVLGILLLAVDTLILEKRRAEFKGTVQQKGTVR